MLSPRPSSAFSCLLGAPSLLPGGHRWTQGSVDGQWAPQDNRPAQSVSQRDEEWACTMLQM